MDNRDILQAQQQFGIVGKSPLLLQAIHAALQAAPYDVNVLVVGENGVGKETFHKILHQYSKRRFGKCIAVNCGGLPEGTIDSELFGHVKGAYTGAVGDRKGYFEEADGGTIFLDEVGELPMTTQARLLRVLESGEFLRMGSSEVRKTDVRIVAATNVELEKAVRRGTFREDLFYRLSTITIRVPALRERPEDIFTLFRKFASDIASRYKMPPVSLTDDARRKLLAYQWPGNVRQLLHLVEELSIVEEEREIDSDTLMRHLPQFDERIVVSDEMNDGAETFKAGEKQMLYRLIFEMQKQLEDVRHKLGLSTHASASASRQPQALPPASQWEQSLSSATDVIEAVEAEEVPSEHSAIITPPPATAVSPSAATRPQTLDDIEREAIRSAMDRNHGNKRKAAAELGISERTIHRKIQDYGLL